MLLLAAEQVGETGRVVGVDLFPAMLGRAEVAVRERGLCNVELRLGDAEQLDFGRATFDLVLCSFGLSSFADKDRALSAFLAVLRPGGRVGLVDTFGWYFQHDPRWRGVEAVFHAFGALHAGRAQVDLQILIAGAGFTDVETVEDTCELVFADEEEWWGWSRSHGTRLAQPLDVTLGNSGHMTSKYVELSTAAGNSRQLHVAGSVDPLCWSAN